MMRASPSPSCNSTSVTNRLKTIFKKAYELSILCDIEVCVIYYGPDGELKTWPEERKKVKDMALRYKEATKLKKSLNIHEPLKKKQKKNLKYPNFDHYSPDQLAQLIQSLERTLSTLQERLRFVEAKKQRNANLIYQSLTPSSLNQTQPLNPSKFSLYMSNHEDETLSQLPLSASHSNQLTSYQNHLMQQKPCGLGQNMCMGNVINSNVLERPCVSNTQAYSPLLSVQESAVNNYGLENHLMQQQELYGFGQNMCMMSEITNNNVLRHPSLSNSVPHEFCSDFQKNPYGDAVGNTSFSQDMSSSYVESSLLRTSSLHLSAPFLTIIVFLTTQDFSDNKTVQKNNS